jgi:hypothetical protein
MAPWPAIKVAGLAFYFVAFMLLGSGHVFRAGN